MKKPRNRYKGAFTFFMFFGWRIFLLQKNILISIFEAFPALWYQKTLVLNFLNIMYFNPVKILMISKCRKYATLQKRP